MDPLKRNWKKLFPTRVAKKIIVFVLVAFIFQLLLSPVPSIVDATFNKVHAKELSENENSGNNNERDLEKKKDKKDNKEDDNDKDDNDKFNASKAKELKAREKESSTSSQNRLPENKGKYKTTRTVYTTVTAYNSEISQCQGDPCITANGFNVCKHGIEDTIATNRLPFGTKIKIPELFGERIFIVRDKMNKRYYNRMDVWMLDKQDAVNFGVKRGVRVQIVKKR